MKRRARPTSERGIVPTLPEGTWLRPDEAALFGCVTQERIQWADILKTHSLGEGPCVPFSAFAQFLQCADSDGEWPFVLCGDIKRPVDFFYAMTWPIEDRHGAQWLTLAAFLEQLRRTVEQMSSWEEARRREALLQQKLGAGT